MYRHLCRALAAFGLLTFVMAARAQDDGFEPVNLPADVAAKVEGLPQEKIDYLRGDGIFRYAGSHEILFRRFENRSVEEVEAYIDAMMRVDELMKFNPDTDMASIPLNTDAPVYEHATAIPETGTVFSLLWMPAT